LRLEQLELNLGDDNRKTSSKKETIIQKILAKKAGLKKVEVGQYVSVEPDLVVSNSNSGSIIKIFEEMGGKKVWDPTKIMIVLDHRIPSESAEVSRENAGIRDFARRRKIKNFYDVGEGICNQVALENAHVLPGNLVLGSHHQATIYGCIGAASAKISLLETAALWNMGRVWMRVPGSVKIVLEGKLGRGVYAKDIILKLIRDFIKQNVDYKALEFYGSTVAALSISERFTLASFAELTTAKTAIVPFDDVTMRYMKKITKSRFTPFMADHEAVYDNVFETNVNYLTPQVSVSGNSGNSVPVEEMAGKKIDLVILGSCSNGRVDDMEVAAGILRGRRINRDLRMIVIPGSRRIMIEAIDKGLIKTFIESGCVIVNPGCGSCLSSRHGVFVPGEKTMTTACSGYFEINGGDDTEVYIASPATAAATALEGCISDPRRFQR
jgi:homoaconitate hydratase family protein